MNNSKQYAIDLEKTDGPMIGDFIIWGDLDLLKDPRDPASKIFVCTCSKCWGFVGLTVYDIRGDEVCCSRCGATSKCNNGIEYRSMREPLKSRMEAKAKAQH